MTSISAKLLQKQVQQQQPCIPCKNAYSLLLCTHTVPWQAAAWKPGPHNPMTEQTRSWPSTGATKQQAYHRAPMLSTLVFKDRPLHRGSPISDPSPSLQLWSPQHRTDMVLLERGQRGPQKWSEGWNPSAVRKGWVRAVQRRLRGDLRAAFQYLKGSTRKLETFYKGIEWQDKGNGFKLKEGRLTLDTRRKFFTVRVVRPWHSLPREAVAAPPWECSRPDWMGLGATWSGGRRPCPWQGGWNWVIWKVTSNPNHSMMVTLVWT